MKRKFVLAAAIAGACFFVAGCESDGDAAAMGNQDTIRAAETNAHCSGKCSGTCEKGDVAAAETKAKGSCCKGEAATCTKKAGN